MDNMTTMNEIEAAYGEFLKVANSFLANKMRELGDILGDKKFEELDSDTVNKMCECLNAIGNLMQKYEIDCNFYLPGCLSHIREDEIDDKFRPLLPDHKQNRELYDMIYDAWVNIYRINEWYNSSLNC